MAYSHYFTELWKKNPTETSPKINNLVLYIISDRATGHVSMQENACREKVHYELLILRVLTDLYSYSTVWTISHLV